MIQSNEHTHWYILRTFAVQLAVNVTKGRILVYDFIKQEINQNNNKNCSKQEKFMFIG